MEEAKKDKSEHEKSEEEQQAATHSGQLRLVGFCRVSQVFEQSSSVILSHNLLC